MKKINIERVARFVVVLLVSAGAVLGQGNTGIPRDGHGSMIHDTAFSPDGKYLASTDESGTLLVWDLAAKRIVFRIDDTDRTTYSEPAFSSDGKIFAAVERKEADPTVLLMCAMRFWDARTGKPLQSPEGEFREIDHLTFSPDSRTLVAETDLNETTFWDVATLKVKKELFEGAGPYAYNGQGTLIAAANKDKTSILIVDTKTGQTIRTIPSGHFLVTLAFDPAGELIAATDEEKDKGCILKVWNAKTGARVNGFAPVDQHPPVAFAEGGKSVVAIQFEEEFGEEPGASTRIGALFDPLTGKKQRDLVINRPVTAFASAFSAGGRYLTVRWSSSVKNTVPESSIVLLDLQTGTIAAELKGYSRKVKSLGFPPDGNSIVAAYADANVVWWDPRSGRPAKTFSLKTTDPDDQGEVTLLPGLKVALMNGFLYDAGSGELVESQAENGAPFFRALNANGTRGLVVDEGRVIIYDIPRFVEVAGFKSPLPETDESGGEFAISPDGKFVALAYGTGIGIFDSKTGRKVKQIPIGSNVVVGISYSPNGKYLGIARRKSELGLETVVAVLNPLTGGVMLTKTPYSPYFAFSPDSLSIATITESARINITRIADKKTISESATPFRSLIAPVHIAFNPKFPLIAAGSEYGVQVFDVNTGAQTVRLK